jgi:hypothetical protein
VSANHQDNQKSKGHVEEGHDENHDQSAWVIFVLFG